MGVLDGLVGGAVGAGVISAVSSIINQHGGVQGVVEQFQKQRLGGTIQSWINPGENKPITPEQVHQALGADTVNKAAQQSGMEPRELLNQLAQHLPNVIAQLTPNGQVPAGNPLEKQ